MAGRLDEALGFHEQALRLRAQRQQLLATNIANADTPNYKAQDFDFAQAMKAAQPIFGSQFQQVGQPRKPYQWLIDSGLIEIEAMTFIRGRSIGHAFMIVDEAQNMTPHEAKTVITRIGEGSKLVLIGDLDQVDTPYLDGKSNGLIHTHERMKGHSITANVRLLHGVRSVLSELASKLM